jgi:DNA (cytosine-5)-methyltransferase 1
MPSIIYNEIDPYVCEWLRGLIRHELVEPGAVLEHDIAELGPASVRTARQFHAFAGIGLWSHALRLAGWPDDVPVWTGSCPCQPFSVAGRRRGTEDKRHLWPEWRRLIRECRPAVIFGEQVGSPAGRAWLDAVSADLEALGYAVGAADLCAAGVGAPHIRQRLFFVASSTGGLGDADGAGGWGDAGTVLGEKTQGTVAGIVSRRLPHQPELAGVTRGHWANADWLACRDGRARPVEPGSFPLAHGYPGRVAQLRAIGNAIVPQVAAAFIEASMEAIKEAQS